VLFRSDKKRRECEMTRRQENGPHPKIETGAGLRSAKRSSKSSTSIVPQLGSQEKHDLPPKDELLFFLKTLYGENTQGCLTLWARPQARWCSLP